MSRTPGCCCPSGSGTDTDRRAAAFPFAGLLPRWICLLAIVLCGPKPATLFCNERTSGEAQVIQWQNGFEEGAPSWKVSVDDSSASTAFLRTHQRTTQMAFRGESSEEVRVDSTRRGGRLFMEHECAPALVFDELTASVSVRCNRPGARIGVRIVLPRQPDPRQPDRRPVTADFWGETCQVAQRWQTISCRTSDDEIRQLIGRLRAQLVPLLETTDIDIRGMYVDRIILVQDFDVGASEYYLDELTLRPVIDPRSNGGELAGSLRNRQTSPVMTMGDDRVLFKGQPFFPLILPYHGEQMDSLARTGVNIVWVPQHDANDVFTAAKAAGLGAMTTPPAADVRPADPAAIAGGVLTTSYEVGVPPLSHVHDAVLFWNVGNRLRGSSLASLRAAVDAVRDADPMRRPILADVVENEREFHRSVDLLGFTKHTLHTATPPLAYAAFLQQKKLQALRGKPTFTCIQVEPSLATLQGRSPHDAFPVVTAEQIWMQISAALGAGAKGLCYWTHASLESDEPGAAERLHAITLAHLEIHILRDWLATGIVVDQARVRIGDADRPGAGGTASLFANSWNRIQGADPGKAYRLASEIRAPILRCDYGWLILPQWLPENGQFEPPGMTAQDLQMLVPPADSFQAWAVTSTGIHPYHLRATPTSGGLEIELKHFDQRAMIVLTDDADAVDRLKRDAALVRERAAESWLALAEARMEHVLDVHTQLQGLAPRQPRNADFVLGEARRELSLARQAHQQQHCDGVRLAAQRVLRLTRQVQRAHWEVAAAELSSGVATPYTISFSTLPDFWKLTRRLATAVPDEDSLLPGGEFEDWDTLFASGWQHKLAPPADDMAVVVELVPDGVQGRALRLAALPTDRKRIPAVIQETPVRFTTPPVSVFSGQIVEIRGKLRFDVPPSRHVDGLMIYDSLVGTVGALRWRDDAPTGEWIPFGIVRPVQRSGEMQLTIELRGLGDVRLDQFEISTLRDTSADFPARGDLPPAATSTR